MEDPQNTNLEQSKLLKRYYKPDYSQLFQKSKIPVMTAGEFINSQTR